MGQTHTKSTLLLIEMMVVILLLAVAGALCVQVFAASHAKSVGAEELSRAEELSGGAADVLMGSDEDEKLDLAVYYPQAEKMADGITVYYDEDWQPCEKGASSYRMEITVKEKSGQRQGLIRVLRANGEEIYTLDTVVHIRYHA